MSSNLRLVLSALISFVFYFAWTYWANNMVSEDSSLVLRSAIVQGTLSATITLLFTFALEKSVQKFGQSSFSLIFVVPIICTVHSKTTQNIAIFKTFNAALNLSAQKASGTMVPGTLLAPILPLLVQATIAITVNWLNQTPNLWLTVAPSIFFTGVYGYVYTFTLLKDREASV
ncbi:MULTISPECIES: hypothetical protein [Alteromonadaceae]|uniref:hypothetical protein n=1 Tax=Alteromonadaceae TaxID=72275 RepID=UPI001C099D54|nr:MULTISPECIES: hypothetical protein [Aliiglaciecola]MBU2878783.1 hypothetical protein [Aliiglaciecola lipolytica]MDO6711319.1 hypothetical protein [Aliiglaciecola sp. 2_MG-2023]MDO6752232.1 hypothetical protein [Aliiglaciecola sp. 1_MG-2023]